MDLGPRPGMLLFTSALRVENMCGWRQIESRINMGEKRTKIKNMETLSSDMYFLGH